MLSRSVSSALVISTDASFKTLFLHFFLDALYLVTGIGLAESGIMCKCAPSLVDVSEEYEITVGIYELCQACLTAIRLCFGELRVVIVSLVGFGH